jgi:hypothetical protein
MKRYKMQPLAQYSSYIMEESITSPGADPQSQEFLMLFFSLRDSNEDRYKIEAAELLAHKVLVTTAQRTTFHYELKGKDFHCTTSPAGIHSLDYPLTYAALGWRKSTNRIILVDRIADCEARAMLNYSTQD